jgi:hypothetical protein
MVSHTLIVVSFDDDAIRQSSLPLTLLLARYRIMGTGAMAPMLEP